MSHLVRGTMTFADRDTLVQAIQKSGHDVVTEHATVRDYYGNRQPVDMKFDIGKYDVGFAIDKQTGTYRSVADWWGIRSYDHITQKDVEDAIARAYVEIASESLVSQGYVQQDIEEDTQQVVYTYVAYV